MGERREIRKERNKKEITKPERGRKGKKKRIRDQIKERGKYKKGNRKKSIYDFTRKERKGGKKNEKPNKRWRKE